MANLYERVRTYIVVQLSVWLLIFGASLPLASAQAVTFTSTRNCDSNAVIFCGALSVPELQAKYRKSTSVAAMYAYFGVDATAIKNLTTTASAGSVTKDGKVIVNGTVVAIDAVTAGRQNSAGSTTVNYQNVLFYKRTPAVSFQQDALDAFVVMKNNTFAYAIIASCGNVVSAVPVAPSTPIASATPSPGSTPIPTPSSSTSPSPTPVAAAPSTPPPPAQLTNTGAGNALGIFATFSVAGAVSYWLYLRRRFLHS